MTASEPAARCRCAAECQNGIKTRQEVYRGFAGHYLMIRIVPGARGWLISAAEGNEAREAEVVIGKLV